MHRQISHTREGDLLLNNESKDVFKVVHYQWTFCPECSKPQWMHFCEKSKDPQSLHYRYYVLENIRNGKHYEVSGEYLDDALEEKKIKITNYYKGYYK